MYLFHILTLYTHLKTSSNHGVSEFWLQQKENIKQMEIEGQMTDTAMVVKHQIHEKKCNLGTIW